MTYSTYYETGSQRAGTLKIHRKTYKTRAAAVRAAEKLTKRRKGWVTVMRGGLEVAACHRGSCER